MTAHLKCRNCGWAGPWSELSFCLTKISIEPHFILPVLHQTDQGHVVAGQCPKCDGWHFDEVRDDNT